MGYNSGTLALMDWKNWQSEYFKVKQAVKYGLYLDRIQLFLFPKDKLFLEKKIAEENWVHLEGNDEKSFKNTYFRQNMIGFYSPSNMKSAL